MHGQLASVSVLSCLQGSVRCRTRFTETKMVWQISVHLFWMHTNSQQWTYCYKTFSASRDWSRTSPFTNASMRLQSLRLRIFCTNDDDVPSTRAGIISEAAAKTTRLRQTLITMQLSKWSAGVLGNQPSWVIQNLQKDEKHTKSSKNLSRLYIITIYCMRVWTHGLPFPQESS